MNGQGPVEASLGAALIADRYRVIERIGQGGMGNVYLAEHVHMKKSVALKVLHREMTRLPEAVARFEREAIAAGNIDHPNVAKATDFGRLPDGSFFLVLEFVEGKTLSQVLSERELTLDDALMIAKQIAEALAAAHTAGIVHRDLKPDNIMLVERTGEPDLVKVLDFGIAKMGTMGDAASRIPLTRMGSVFGTPEYMAPEQAAGQAVDLRADLYALGVVLYRMVAGREPFTDEDVSRVLMQQVTQPPPALPNSVTPEVKELIFDLLRKDPAHRIQTADEACARIVYCSMAQSVNSDGRWFSRWRLRSEIMKLKGLSGGLGHTRSPAALLRKIVSKLDGGLLGRSVDLHGRQFRLWQPLGAGLLALGAVGLAMISFGTLKSPNESHSDARPNAQRARDQVLLSEVVLGKPTAIAALELRPGSERSTEEWLALGQGRAVQGRFSGAIEAYQEAVLREQALAQNPTLAHDVWLAAQKPDVAAQALQFAALHLGSKGADLLYKVWVDLSRAVTPTTALAKELLHTQAVRRVTSEALRTTLELRAAQSCDDYGRLLPKVMLYGDARSVRVLLRVQTEQTCPALDSALQTAIAAVKDRPEPRF